MKTWTVALFDLQLVVDGVARDLPHNAEVNCVAAAEEIVDIVGDDRVGAKICSIPHDVSVDCFKLTSGSHTSNQVDASLKTKLIIQPYDRIPPSEPFCLLT